MNTSGTFYMYSGVCIAGTVFLYFFVPETMMKTPTDMRNYFEDHKTARKSKQESKVIVEDMIDIVE